MTHQDYVDGYMDGLDKNTPAPNNNRSPRYIHSFGVGRAEIAHDPIPYHQSMARVQEIEAAEQERKS